MGALLSISGVKGFASRFRYASSSPSEVDFDFEEEEEEKNFNYTSPSRRHPLIIHPELDWLFGRFVVCFLVCHLEVLWKSFNDELWVKA
jgi:hypothetical protein